ncbi:ParB N-terminal domain-containing protein, partial [bacterium]|nr:ParB N-terminal domain-containing protein [bacterium]
MNTPLNINGIDLPLAALKTLKDRERVNLKTHRGYLRLRASIQAVGLIEPLSVYAEGGSYVILDGYLRFLACKELRIESVPCIIYTEKDAYTFNRMVNRLSGFQEMRMLRKSLETLD